MRIDRYRRYCARPVKVGPLTITKEVVPEDSCVAYTYSMGEETNSTLVAPDPLGVDAFNVAYSLNKKQRWTLPDKLKEDIEELQDPHHNLRVSAATHELDVAQLAAQVELTGELRNRPARSYHTVSRDGKKVVNNYAKKGQARMQTLINPKGLKPWDYRKDQWKRKKQREHWDENQEIKSYLPEEDREDQKLHVMYSTVEMTTSSRPPKEKNAPKKRGTVARKHHDWALDTLPESDLEDEEEEEEQPTTPLAPPVVPSLAAFLVPAHSKHAHPRHPRSKRESFVDEESFRTSSLSLISGGEILVESSTDEEEEAEPPTDVVIVESPSRIVLVSAMPQLYTKIRLSDCALEQLVQPLPVFPRAWEVHAVDTQRVLGRAFPICIVAKELEDGEASLFGQESCLTCADRMGRFGILLDDKDTVPEGTVAPVTVATACPVCCKAMAADTVFEQSRPFALACGHAACTSCWLQTISDGMKKGRAPAGCMEPSCSVTLSITAASALLDSASLRKYTDTMTEMLLRQQAIVRCRDCSRLHRVVSSKPSVRCSCGTSICARCSSVAHAPVSCKAFRDYCNYMQTNGLNSAHVSSADAPIVRNLAQCPKCGQLGEPQYEWCPNLECPCGERFCHKCSRKWTDAHWSCDAEGLTKSVTMIDVSSSRDSDLHQTMLTLSIGARLSYFERRREVMERLQSLSIKTRKEFDKTFTRLSHLMEICYLNSTKSKRSQVLADRIQFAMSYFFNTEDKNRRNLLRKTELLRKILNDISAELFGGPSSVNRKKEIK